MIPQETNIFVILFTLLFGFGEFSPPHEHQLVGIWANQSGDTLHFQADGATAKNRTTWSLQPPLFFRDRPLRYLALASPADTTITPLLSRSWDTLYFGNPTQVYTRVRATRAITHNEMIGTWVHYHTVGKGADTFPDTVTYSSDGRCDSKLQRLIMRPYPSRGSWSPDKPSDMRWVLRGNKLTHYAPSVDRAARTEEATSFIPPDTLILEGFLDTMVKILE